MISANERTFYASGDKGLFLLGGSIGFVILGYALRNEAPVIAWASMAFFGLGIPAGLILTLMPHSQYLRLDPDGFEMKSVITTIRIKWTDVERFELITFRGSKMIAIVYAPHYEQQKIGRLAARMFSGMDGAIANVYDVPLPVVLAALDEWLARYRSTGLTNVS